MYFVCGPNNRSDSFTVFTRHGRAQKPSRVSGAETNGFRPDKRLHFKNRILPGDVCVNGPLDETLPGRTVFV